jgi:hypothetical protein
MRDPVLTKHSSIGLCQITYLKSVLKLRRNTPAWIVYRELGLYPMQYYTLRNSIRFLNRVLQLNDREYVKMALQQTIKDSRTAGVDNWFTRLQNLLNHIGFDIPDNTGTDGINPRDVQHAWREFYQQHVWSNLHDDPPTAPSEGARTCTYHHYFAFDLPTDGTEWKMSPYLTNPRIPHKHCINLARFRTGNHDLRVEILKRIGTPREQRICNKCNCNSVQDEPHFILDCPVLDELRGNYPSCFNSQFSIRQLFTNMHTQHALSSFITEATDILKDVPQP